MAILSYASLLVGNFIDDDPYFLQRSSCHGGVRPKDGLGQLGGGSRPL